MLNPFFGSWVTMCVELFYQINAVRRKMKGETEREGLSATSLPIFYLLLPLTEFLSPKLFPIAITKSVPASETDSAI